MSKINKNESYNVTIRIIYIKSLIFFDGIKGSTFTTSTLSTVVKCQLLKNWVSNSLVVPLTGQCLQVLSYPPLVYVVHVSTTFENGIEELESPELYSQ